MSALYRLEFHSEEAAREHEADDDPDQFKDKLKKLVKHKPVEKPK